MEPLRLPSSIDDRFVAWLPATRERLGDLATRDLRRGIQAVSRVYVEERGGGDLGGRATGGAARRAAFASYYAPLHFLTAWHLANSLREDETLGGTPRRIVDLGCGTGAVGAAFALGYDEPPRVEGLDALGWAAGETRHTYKALGVRGRARRARLPEALPPLGPADLVTCGWFVNECDAASRVALEQRLAAAARSGARIVVLEPLAGRVAPWWSEWVASFEALGLRTGLWKEPVELPDFLLALDHASGLDHSTLGVRWIAGGAW